jgi:exonuclease VII large subunit
MAPRTVKEALVAEMLGEIDALLTRCETCSAAVSALQAQMASSTATLDAAGERYRITISTYTEQVKQEVSHYLERKTSEASAKMLASQQEQLQEAVLRILQSAVKNGTGKSRPVWTRLAELSGVAILAGICGASIVYWLIR